MDAVNENENENETAAVNRSAMDYLRPIHLSIMRKMSSMLFSVFRSFLIINAIIMVIAITNVVQSEGTAFRGNFWMFCMLIFNFWMMVIFFFLISMCMKMCIFSMSPPSYIEENAEVFFQNLLMFPMMIDEVYYDEDSMFVAATNESMRASPSSPTRSPPTLDRLMAMELKWGFCSLPIVATTSAEKEEKCLICLQDMTHSYATFQGIISLSCHCNTLFHKKCILEWFHFNEKEASDTEPSLVTCPSCRHAFTAL